MYGLLKNFDFSVFPFLAGMPRFVNRYFKSRAAVLLLPSAFAFLTFVTLLLIFVWVGSEKHQQNLHSKYRALTEQAVEEGNPAADIYFAKVLTFSSDPRGESFKYAKQLYEISKDSDDLTPQLLSAEIMNAETFPPSLRRALVMMQSLAPRRHTEDSYPPAQKFMAEYWRARQPQSEIIQVLALQHDMYGAPNDREPAIKLAKKIAGHNYHAHAIEVLQRHRNDAEVLMLLAASYSKSGDLTSANQSLRQATDLLRTKLTEDPRNVDARIRLSRCVATQSRILESMFILVEGYTPQTPAVLVDQLIQRYTIWLQLMSQQNAMLQLNDIALALKFAPQNTGELAADEFEELSLSTGEKFSLPAPIVQLHTMLLNGEGRFLIPLLLGTEKNLRGEFEEARKLLEEARRIAPGHPVIDNNLAWTLLKEVQSVSSLNAAKKQASVDNRSAEMIDRAFDLSSAAVAKCPDVPSFRATKGIIAAQASKWEIAVLELKSCVKSGAASAEVHGQLKFAERNLAQLNGSKP